MYENTQRTFLSLSVFKNSNELLHNADTERQLDHSEVPCMHLNSGSGCSVDITYRCVTKGWIFRSCNDVVAVVNTIYCTPSNVCEPLMFANFALGSFSRILMVAKLSFYIGLYTILPKIANIKVSKPPKIGKSQTLMATNI